MSFGAGFNQGSAAVARGLAQRQAQQKLQLAQQESDQKTTRELMEFFRKNPNVKPQVVERLHPGATQVIVENAFELAKVLKNEEERQKSGEAGAAAFTPLITDPKTGLPGAAALAGANAQTAGERLDFSQFVEGIQQLPPEQRVPLTNQLGSAIQAAPLAQQAQRRGQLQEFQTFVDKERTKTELAEASRERSAERAEARVRERPSAAFKNIEQNVNAGIMTREEGDNARRAVVRLDSIGAAANAEALRQGFELSSSEQQTMGTIGDLAVTDEMLGLAMSLPPETLRKFTGISGRAFRFASGVTAGIVDFTEAFGDDKPRVDAWMQEQFALGPLEAEDTGGGFFGDTPRDEIRNSIRFLEDRKALGTFDAYILASQIALARANTRGGRITRVALDQAKEQIDPNRFSDSDAVLSSLEGARKGIAVRGRVLERQLRVTQGARISPAIQGVREAASALSENPGSVPTTLSPERQQEEDQEIADEIKRETERGLSKDAKSALELFDRDMERIEGQQPRSLRESAGANLPRRVVRDPVTRQPVRGTGAAIGVPAGTRR
jgi:hypothetical protein